MLNSLLLINVNINGDVLYAHLLFVYHHSTQIIFIKHNITFIKNPVVILVICSIILSNLCSLSIVLNIYYLIDLFVTAEGKLVTIKYTLQQLKQIYSIKHVNIPLSGLSLYPIVFFL